MRVKLQTSYDCGKATVKQEFGHEQEAKEHIKNRISNAGQQLNSTKFRNIFFFYDLKIYSRIREYILVIFAQPPKRANLFEKQILSNEYNFFLQKTTFIWSSSFWLKLPFMVTNQWVL